MNNYSIDNTFDSKPHWNLERFKYNSGIKEMTDQQHRAICMLAYYRRNFLYNKDCFETNNIVAGRIYTNFFLKSLPIMLKSSNLPDLNLKKRFTEKPDCEDILRDVDEYLRYIDRKYGTWYAPKAA